MSIFVKKIKHRMNMSNQSFISEMEAFKKSFFRLKENEGLSDLTLRNYSDALNPFFDYLVIQNREKKYKLTFKHIDEDFIYNFIDWVARQHDKKFKASTKKQYIVRIGNFLRYVDKKNNRKYGFSTLFEDIKIKVPERKRKVLSQTEIGYLKQYFEYLDGIQDIKDTQKLIIAKLLLGNGLRAVELRGLKVSDFTEDGDMYSILITGKGNKQRYVYCPISYISKELEYIKSLGYEYIAYDARGNGLPMTHSQLYYLMKKIYEEAGFDKTGVHILRHTFATAMIDKDVNLITLMELMGHTKVSTTQIYAKSNEKAKKEAMRKMNIENR